MFVDCYSRYTILVPSSNHTANTVSEALLRHVVPYFGTPRRLLSDRGREFVSEVWGKLLRSLGVQRVLTSPYHPEGNAINERSHRTLNNMLCARLLEGSSSRYGWTKSPASCCRSTPCPTNLMGSLRRWLPQDGSPPSLLMCNRAHTPPRLSMIPPTMWRSSTNGCN